MMRSALCFLTLVLLANHAHTLPAAASQLIPEQPTEQEAREAREVAAGFMGRIQQTRDIAALKDLYVADFVRRRLETEEFSLSDFGSPLFHRVNLKTEAALREWERFYAAQVNLNYFMALYFIATNHEFLTREPTLSEICPPEVMALLKVNPLLAEQSPEKKYKLETLEELRGVIATLERAGALMRERFSEHPPEQTEQYRENVRAWVREEPEEAVYIEPEGRYGLPAGTRFFRLRTSPQFFDLTLIRTGKGMKLVWAKVYVFD
jgi:hypothetical protein